MKSVKKIALHTISILDKKNRRFVNKKCNPTLKTLSKKQDNLFYSATMAI